jgi:hypothetical protein
MSTFMNLLMVAAYLVAAHAVWVPSSAWVAADREKWAWVVMLAVPGINIFVLVAYAVGVLPLLLPQHAISRNHPMRHSGPGGYATSTAHPGARATPG